MSATAPPAIVLFRKDLRLADNPALSAAIERGGPVILLHIRETDDPNSAALGAAQGWWQHHSIAALQSAIEKTGNRLILATAEQNLLVTELVKTVSPSAVYWNRRYHKRGRDNDATLKTWLLRHGVDARSFAANLLHEPANIQSSQGNYYRVYTPFWKALRGKLQLPSLIDAPNKILAPAQYPPSEKLEDWGLLPTRPNWAKGFEETWRPGEAGAMSALDDFISSALHRYRDGRDLPSKRYTSRLSPHLACGEITPTQIWQHIETRLAHEVDLNSEKFLQELVWREFCWHIFFHSDDMQSQEFNAKFSDFAWGFDETLFDRWTKGETGYPIVDAGMRELWQTGWMHNRVRMITASFLVKHLMIDWRYGERWFRDTLVDADAASNAASWQWVAGCGADAAPYFRIFNPILQGEKFDQDGDYVRRYVPEIANLPDKFIHRPFDAPSDVLEKAGIALGHSYPRPIVEHAKARARALDAFQRVKTSQM